MHLSGRREVSLRGASAREVSRAALLSQVAEERAVRGQAKKNAAAASLIQRVWRGRSAAASHVKTFRLEWDQRWLGGAGGKGPSSSGSRSAVVISRQLLAPLLFLLHRPGAATWRLDVSQGDEERLKVALVILLQSIDRADPAQNYCALAHPDQSQASTWRFQTRRLLSLCCALLGGKYTVSGQSLTATSAPIHTESVPLQLTGLAMRIAVALTDAATWKCYSQPGARTTQANEKLPAGSATAPASTGRGSQETRSPNPLTNEHPPAGSHGPVTTPLPPSLNHPTPTLLDTPMCKGRPDFEFRTRALEGQAADPEPRTFPGTRAHAEAVVQETLLWLACGGGGLYPSLRCHLEAHCPVPEAGEGAGPTGRGGSEAFLATAAAVTVALRPLLGLGRGPGTEGGTAGAAATAGKGGPPDASRKLPSAAAAAGRAAGQVAVEVLSLPLLVRRLPGALLPALRHASALGPCLRALGVPLPALTKVCGRPSVTSSATCPDSTHLELPPSAWTLANIAVLATPTPAQAGEGKPSPEGAGPIASGISPAEYLRATCCLMEDLGPWIENHQRMRKRPGTGSGAVDGGEGDEDEEGSASWGSAEGGMGLESKLVHPLFLTDLQALYQRGHVLGLLNMVREGKGLGMGEFGKLYLLLMRVCAGLNPAGGGAVPILNVLAFTPQVIPALWEWLQGPLGLARPQGPSAAPLHGEASRPRSSGSAVDSIHSGSNSNGRDEFRTSTAHGSRSTDASRGGAGGPWAPSFGRGGEASTSGSGKQAGLLGSRRVVGGSEGDARSGREGGAGRGLEEVVGPATGWEVAAMKKGVAGVAEEATAVLTVFCATYAHLLMVLDDEEFHERQVPFPLPQQRLIAASLNTLVYTTFLSSPPHRPSAALDAATRCLRSLYERDCRRGFCPPELWLAPAAAQPPPIAAAARAHGAAEATARLGEEVAAPGMGSILNTIPHVLPFEDRVFIFRELVRGDKARGGYLGGGAPGQPGGGAAMEVAVRRQFIVEDGFAQLNRLGPRLKGRIHVAFVSEVGLPEAGLDYGGLFKEFLTDLAKAAFDPRYGLFAQTATEEGLLYPHPAAASRGPGLPMVEFLGRIVGKALYEGVLLDYSFAPLFVAQLIGRYAFLDELAELDGELHRNLMYLKHYEGDVQALALDFTTTEEVLGRRRTVELRPGGADVAVTNENKLQYVHAMADYKLNRQMRRVVGAFLRGLSDLIAPSWLRLFNAREFNQLLSGGDHDFDVEDLRRHTQYSGGYTEASRPVRLFWDVVARLGPAERCALLKFVTSCSRAPLLGFHHLHPPFTIHKVACDAPIWAAVAGPDVDRLPSASTCYNTLKLPTYRRASTLREKLKYAIKSNSGFELS